MAVGRAQSLAESLTDNPVILRDLRARMRGTRTYWVLFIYLGFLSLSVYIAYQTWWSTHARFAGSGMGGGQTASDAGSLIFHVIFYVQAVLISLITPALTSGAISMERQQRTFDLLRATILPSRAIILGKLVSSLSFVALLMVSSVPIVAISFLLGGVSPGQIIATFAMLLCDAALFGAVGLMWSSCCNTTTSATALTYGWVLAYFVITVVWAFSTSTSAALSALNPVGSLTAGSTMETYYGLVKLPAWLVGLIVNGGLAALLVLVSANRIEDKPGQRSIWLRFGVLAMTAVILFFVDGSWSALGPATTPPDRLLWLSYCAMIALVVAIPPFATGLPEEDDPDDRSGTVLDSWRLNRITVDSGGPMSLLIGIVVALTSLVAIGMVTGSNAVGTAVATASISPHRKVLLTAMTAASPTFVCLALVFDCIAIAAAMAGLGRLFSYLLKSRWVSALWVYVVFIGAAFIPYVSYDAIAAAGGRVPHDPLINTLYLSPIAVVQHLCYQPGAQFSSMSLLDHVAFAKVASPAIVMAFLYLAIAVLALYFAERAKVRRMYDETLDPAFAPASPDPGTVVQSRRPRFGRPKPPKDGPPPV